MCSPGVQIQHTRPVRRGGNYTFIIKINNMGFSNKQVTFIYSIRNQCYIRILSKQFFPNIVLSYFIWGLYICFLNYFLQIKSHRQIDQRHGVLSYFFSIQICFKLPKFPEELKDNGIYLNKVFFFYTVFFWIAN